MLLLQSRKQLFEVGFKIKDWQESKKGNVALKIAALLHAKSDEVQEKREQHIRHFLFR